MTYKTLTPELKAKYGKKAEELAAKGHNIDSLILVKKPDSDEYAWIIDPTYESDEWVGFFEKEKK